MKKLWIQGRKDYKEFANMSLKGYKSSLAFIFSLVLTILTVLPVALVIYQLYSVFFYHRPILNTLIGLSWLLLLLCNGLSNYFTLEISKCYYHYETKLQKLSSKGVFVYQTFNIGFAVATFVILLFVVWVSNR